MLKTYDKTLEYWERISFNIYGGLGSAIHLFIEFTNWLQKENPNKDLGWCYQHTISIRFWDNIKSLTVQKHQATNINYNNCETNSELKQQNHDNHNSHN